MIVWAKVGCRSATRPVVFSFVLAATSCLNDFDRYEVVDDPPGNTTMVSGAGGVDSAESSQSIGGAASSIGSSEALGSSTSGSRACGGFGGSGGVAATGGTASNGGGTSNAATSGGGTSSGGSGGGGSGGDSAGSGAVSGAESSTTSMLQCDAPLVACSEGCVDVTADSAHCGGCGTSCATLSVAFTCEGGQCGCGSGEACGTGEGVECIARRCACEGASCNVGEVCAYLGNRQRCRCNGSGACPSGQVCCPDGCSSEGCG